MSYGRFIKHLSPGRKVTREEYEAQTQRLGELDLPSLRFSYPIPFAVYLIEAQKSEEERRHQEILAALAPTISPAGRPRKEITEWALEQLEIGRDWHKVREEFIDLQPNSNLDSLNRQFGRIKRGRTK